MMNMGKKRSSSKNYSKRRRQIRPSRRIEKKWSWS
jgi:hypothetical protein